MNRIATRHPAMRYSVAYNTEAILTVAELKLDMETSMLNF